MLSWHVKLHPGMSPRDLRCPLFSDMRHGLVFRHVTLLRAVLSRRLPPDVRRGSVFNHVKRGHGSVVTHSKQ